MDVWDDPRVAEGLRRQLAALVALEAGGADLIGWKVGLGAPAAREQAGITGPLVGYLTSRTVVADGAEVPVTGWTRPAVEPELALWIGEDQVLGGIGQAIELADVDRPLGDVTEIVAGNIFHRAVILGAARTQDLDGLRITVTRNGMRTAHADDPTALTGPPADLVAHVAAWLHAAGRRLEAGQVIIAGSTTPLVLAEAGDEIGYHCDSLGHLGVRLV